MGKREYYTFVHDNVLCIIALVHLYMCVYKLVLSVILVQCLIHCTHYNVMYITSTMLSIFGRAGAILLAVVDVSHALYA